MYFKIHHNFYCDYFIIQANNPIEAMNEIYDKIERRNWKKIDCTLKRISKLSNDELLNIAIENDGHFEFQEALILLRDNGLLDQYLKDIGAFI